MLPGLNQIKKFLSICIFIIIPTFIYAQNFIVDTTTDYKNLITKHFLYGKNEGLKVNHITFHGQKGSVGVFTYKSIFNNLPAQGIILSTGMAYDACGKNTSIASTENNFPGDSELENIVHDKTYDAAILEFDFFSLSDSIAFVFQFASEEYPEYVGSGVSDIFAFLIEDKLTGIKKNLAVLPNSDTPITVDLINSETNREYYISNSYIDYKNNKGSSKEANYLENSNLFKFDGFTQPIKSGLKVTPFHTYHFKIAITDVGDRKFDSWILLKANSFAGVGKIINPGTDELNKFFKFENISDIETALTDSNLQLTAPIFFEFNSSIINKESYSILNQITEILKFSNYKMIINGYADKKGDESYNLKLSKERADSVYYYFIKKGIDSKRLKSFGKGEIPQDDDYKSRKVEFILK